MPTAQSNPSAREKLLRAAAELFYARGITATGIDTVITRAGVAKMSLYNNFSSKSDLIAAYIDARHDDWLALYNARADGLSNGWELILAVFDAYIDHAEFEYEDGFRGCGLLNAAAEMPANSAQRDAVCRHKQQVRSIILECLNTLPLINEQPETAGVLAEHICFLLEGAMSLAGLNNDIPAISRAKDMADKLIEQAL